MKLNRATALLGRIELPGDKSISHRAAMFLAMADGEAAISNFASSADCASTLECLSGLGVKVRRNGNEVVIGGVGKHGFVPPTVSLDCGNSGTTMRLLSGVLAGQDFKSVLTGDGSLRSRPMMRVIRPLTEMGAVIGSQDGKAPLEIRGGELKAIDHELPVASAQIKSCVLLAGLNAKGRTTVLESTQSRDHTERMLRWLGVEVNEEHTERGVKLSVAGDARLTARDIIVPADISSAAFFLAAAACLPGSRITLPGIGLNPSRTGVLDALRMLGADIEVMNEREAGNEPVGDLVVRGGLREAEMANGNILKGRVIANLIDEIPVLAVFGTQIEGGLEIRDAAELRVKESDRIAAVVENLRRMKADVEEFEDGLRVRRSKLHGAAVDSFGDHRIAMAFGVAALVAEGETEIEGAGCAAVSFPDFFDALARTAEN